MRKFSLILVIFLTSCDTWNSPYPDEKLTENSFYTFFNLKPKHFDPARSYSTNEAAIIGQIYEPPLQYHYLKKPYHLEALVADSLPKVAYFDTNNQFLRNPRNVAEIKTSVYTIKIKPNVFYQPHPAFSERDNNYQLKPIETDMLQSLFVDTPNINKRELIAEDFVYQIKRLAHPKLHSPIFGFMSKYIKELKELRSEIKEKLKDKQWLDLRKVSFSGAKVIDKYTYQITINGKYPQFKLWLAMSFFAPIPWEAEEFYAQEILRKNNINLDWYPIGTGAFMLSVNNPNHKMVLRKNPNFHDDFYPQSGGVDAGKRLPFLDKIVFSLEKEGVSGWNKFLQGYYDSSGISSDNFDTAVNISGGDAVLTDEMKDKGIYLKTTVPPLTYYLGFNMMDKVVGGLGEKNRQLRQAISIAFDYEEYITIFRNGQGIVAQSPIPPGVFGFSEGKVSLNKTVYQWQNGKKKRHSLVYANQLLTKAGYENGIDPKTGKALRLYLDGVDSEGSGNKAELDWTKKQFAKLNIQLVVRNSDYNRFQDKIKKGKAQLFRWGWGADYPDPENFLFLLYGKNSKVLADGENAANYQNIEFDKMFEQMQTMDNSPERFALIQKMLALLQTDAPWLWGYYPKSFGLYHSWIHNKHPNAMANNTFKYLRINPTVRAKKRNDWNQPILWPLILIFLIFGGLFWLGFHAYNNNLKRSIKDKIKS